MNEEIERIHEMWRWSDEKIIDELSRPLSQDDLGLFEISLERHAISRILKYLTQIKKLGIRIK